MWNPKRLLLLILGFLFFLGCYQVYGLFFGQYDGLPPLPAEYRYEAGQSMVLAPKPDVPSHAVELLREAFGSSCEEQHRRIKLEWRPQGIVMAADGWKILHNGQMRLSKVSVAIVGKPGTGGQGKEINTLRGDQADIEFDQPLSERSFMRDAQTRRPVAGKISGSVHLRNNRRTSNPDDDVHLYTNALSYSDLDHRIWTKSDVRIVDSEAVGSSPQAVVTATGMEVALIAEERAEPENGRNKGGRRDGDKRPTITGVRQVVLEKDVCMDLLIDAQSAFLGAGGERPVAARKPGEKSPVVVNCRGPFTYTVSQDPEKEPDVAAFNDLVNVIRKQVLPSPEGEIGGAPAVRYDQLDCEHLTMLFHRRATESGKPPSGNSGNPPQDGVQLDLVRARAVGKQVELVSDSEALHATGVEMIYDRERGRTLLKGDPVEAEKDGHRIHVRGELSFAIPEGDRAGVRDANAQGPGFIRMKTDKAGLVREARWQKELTVSKDGQLDKLTLKENASFEDSEQGRMQADQITVWLENQERTKKAETPTRPRGSAPTAMEHVLLRRLEALGNVSLRSPELVIHRAEQLRLQVEEGAAPTIAQNPTPATGEPPAAVAKEQRTRSAAADVPLGSPRPPLDQTASPHALETSRKRPPIELAARTVDAHTITDGKRTDLKEMHAEGQVVVQQKPLSEQDKPVDVRGDRLTLRRQAEGNVLTVVGQPGFMHLDQLTIMGPLINVDQVQNVVTVQGSGSLKMPTRTDMEGSPLREPAEVTIFWGQRMFFDGQLAEFDQPQVGRVQVSQGEAKLACRMLQVVLDRRISLKDKNPGQGEHAAALHRMLANEGVRLEKGVKQGDRWVEYQRVEGEEALFENPLGELRVYGPGIVHLLRKGGQQALPGQTTPPSDKDELKLTHVRFQGKLVATRNAGVVKIWDDVVLVHLPADDPDLAINPDDPTPASMTLRCQQLNAVQRKVTDKQVYQEFEASGRVTVKARTYNGLADVIKYDESKDLLVLEGHNNLARLFRQLAPGAKPDVVSAKRIQYFRRENRVQLRETEAIQVNPSR